VVASEGGLTVVLDTTPTEALRLEGLARELVNRSRTCARRRTST
jgi:hypothetical protein